MTGAPGHRGTGARNRPRGAIAVRRCVGASVRLAAGAALLVGCSKQAPTRATQPGAAADSADHVMMGMHVTMTSGGVRQANLEADTAFVYESVGRTLVKKTRLTFFTTAGVQQSVLTADSGWYEARSGNMEALGHVVVVRADGSRLNTSQLLYEPSKNQVSTDQFYTYDSGEQHAQATGFVSDPSFSNIVTRRLRGTGGGFTLPGQ